MSQIQYYVYFSVFLLVPFGTQQAFKYIAEITVQHYA